jgi:4-hydroxy-2-oxoheptanedioate aldolase
MPATELKQRWANGEATYGAVVRIGHSWAPEVFAAAGLDFVWVDLQHGFVPIDTLLPIFQSMNGTRATPMARVPSNDAAIIGTVLEAGAEGVIVPMIESADDARLAVENTLHAPRGLRSHGALRLRYLPGGTFRETICIVMIETESGVEHADEIAAVPGVDGVFVGPSDLALSMGIAPKVGIQPGPHAEAIGKIRAACDRHGIVTAITGDAQEMRELGYKMISIGGDHLWMVEAMQAALDRR